VGGHCYWEQEPFCFGSLNGRNHLLYITSFALLLLLAWPVAGMAPDLHQNPEHNHVSTLMYRCTIPSSNFVAHGMALFLLTLPLSQFAYRVKREANKIFLLQATMSISTNSTITIMRLPVHHHNLKMMSDNLTSSPATRAPTHPIHP